MMITYNARIKSRSLYDFDAQLDSSSVCDGGMVVGGLVTLHPEFQTIANEPSHSDQPLIITKNNSFGMLLAEAKAFGKPFTYDDIIPLLKEKYDWLPKESVLERYVRKLCKYNMLYRVRKGVYIYNEVKL